MTSTLVPTNVRMRQALQQAAALSGVHLDAHGATAWGWRGRTIGAAATSGGAQYWLRVAATAVGDARHPAWSGSVTAQHRIPTTVPRPRMLTWHDWVSGHWQYRAELHEHAPSPVIAANPVLQEPVTLTTPWWSQLREALTTLAGVPTRRYTTTRRYLDAMMPRFLGRPLPADRWPWRTAHGDLHLANLCGPGLSILDWEGWGLAPAGYDAATMHMHCLRVPAMAAEVRAHLPELNTPAGRFAELTVITELLHAASRGGHLLLVSDLLARAEKLLGRPVPALGGCSATAARSGGDRPGL